MGEDAAGGQEKRVVPLSAGYERLCPEREELPAELTVDICFKFRGRGFQEFFAEDETVGDLAGEIELVHEIPVANQKYLVPKLGLIKPSEHPDRPVSYLQGKIFQLVGTEAKRVKSFQDAAQRAADRRAARTAARHAKRSGARRTQPSQEELAYTFLDVRPLRFLPNPQRSLDLLNRLKDDPGIRSVMKKHKFTVQLLTEMEPVSNTQESHEGTTRLLGLNRNKGEVIELRLRTDNHQGYRDYKTIRKTLCHELAHNVHGPHDRKFWDLCHQIEREVEVGSGGQALGQESYFQPSSEEDHAEDEGGWIGGEYVLGGGRVEGLSRREILAKAAEERLKRMNATRPDGGRREPGPS